MENEYKTVKCWPVKKLQNTNSTSAESKSDVSANKRPFLSEITYARIINPVVLHKALSVANLYTTESQQLHSPGQ